MAVQWWQSADGNMDQGHRDRSRLLRALAHKALSGPQPADVSDWPASAVDQLISSETLRDLRDDRVTFRHDVLREWGIANLLAAESGEIEHLPFSTNPPPQLLLGASNSPRALRSNAAATARNGRACWTDSADPKSTARGGAPCFLPSSAQRSAPNCWTAPRCMF